MIVNLNEKYRKTFAALASQIPYEPEICIVLGSGLGEFAGKIKIDKSISTASLPDYPKSTVQGHNGFFHFGTYSGKTLLIVQGRIHFYEGYSLSQCILPVHLAIKLNCKQIILTNAAGGVSANLNPGDLMLVSSMNGMNIKKEIATVLGICSLDQKNSFLDFPSSSLNKAIRSAAIEEKINLKEGTYWFTKGPSYETPAEIKMIRKFGGDAVGMSTVHEAVYAASARIKVGSISCITNFAAGLSPQKLSHREVMETAERVKVDFERLVKK